MDVGQDRGVGRLGLRLHPDLGPCGGRKDRSAVHDARDRHDEQNDVVVVGVVEDPAHPQGVGGIHVGEGPKPDMGAQEQEGEPGSWPSGRRHGADSLVPRVVRVNGDHDPMATMTRPARAATSS